MNAKIPKRRVRDGRESISNNDGDRVEQLKSNVLANEMSAKIIVWLVDERRYRAKEIAEALNTSESNVSKLKHGEHALNLGQLDVLARMCGLPMPLLIWRVVGMSPPSAKQSPVHKALHSALKKLYAEHFEAPSESTK